MSYSPYPICLGRKFRKTPQLNRPLVIIFKTSLCDNILVEKNKEKNKIRLLQQIIRLFYKDSLGFRVSAFFKNGKKCEIEDNDVIHLVCHSTKSILKKLLGKLNYEIDDYKLLKRRKYTLSFTFFFNKVKASPLSKNVSLDISCSENEIITFFIISDLFYAKDFIQLLFFFYIDEKLEVPMLVRPKEELDHFDK